MNAGECPADSVRTGNPLYTARLSGRCRVSNAQTWTLSAARTGASAGPHASPALGYGIKPWVFLPPREDEEGPTMGDGDKPRHSAEKAKGKAEEVVGKTTDNP